MSHFTVAVISKEQDGVEALLAPYQENNMCDCPKEYLSFINDEDSDVDEQTGRRGYWENPNAKWDYWTEGGRWGGMIRTKDGRKVDSCQIKNIDFSPNKAVYDWAIRFWEVNVEGQELKTGEQKFDFFSFHTPEYYLNIFGTKEKYAEHEAAFSTFAVVTPDGTWREKGEMGWFGMSSETKNSVMGYLEAFNKILEETDPEYYLTVVDCHI